MAAPSQSRKPLHAIALTASAQDIFTYCPPLSVFQWTRNMNKMAVFKKIICGQSSVERWKNGRLLNLRKSMDFACAAWTRVDKENGCSLL